jgi:hypothetical protein
MNLEKSEISPIDSKKLWTAPVITVIELRAARNGMPAVVSDSGNNNRS